MDDESCPPIIVVCYDVACKFSAAAKSLYYISRITGRNPPRSNLANFWPILKFTSLFASADLSDNSDVSFVNIAVLCSWGGGLENGT